VRVCGGWTSCTHMKWNNKFLAIALSGAGRGMMGRDCGSDLTNVQDKPAWNCHSEFPLYHEYIQIKIFFKYF
jgi:hypothetical protein